MTDILQTRGLELKISWGIVAFGAGLGFFLAWGVLSGDSQGRVNLLYLLLVYLALPLLSLLISCVSLVRGKGFNLARIVTQLPVWPTQKQFALRKMQQLGVDKFWFFFQSQLAALAFSFASLMVLFVLLLATDINFVWRSTLLSADTLYPILKVIALPWQFWNDAQPDIELLRATQDSRLQLIVKSKGHANWWQFVVAVQLLYCVIARSFLIVVAAIWYRRKIANDFESQLSNTLPNDVSRPSVNKNFKEVIDRLPKNIIITNWGGVDLTLVNLLKLPGLSPENFSSDRLLEAGPLVDESKQRVAERWQGRQLVLVKSWEPPLGELQDYLENGNGYIFPLDWDDKELVALSTRHLSEWCRFAEGLSQWQIYLPSSLMPLEST